MSYSLLDTPASPLDRRLRVPILIALGLLALSPLLSSFQTNQHVYFRFTWLAAYLKLTAIQLAAATAFLSLIIIQPVKLRRILSASGVGIPIVAVLAWGLLSAAWSSEPWAAIQPLVELGFLALGVVAFANVFRDPAVRRRFVLAYAIASAVACAAFCACQLNPSIDHLQAYPFLNPNNAAAFALMPFAVGIAYAASALFRRIRPALGVIGIAVAIPAAATLIFSRSAAGMGAALLVFILIMLFTLRGRARGITAEIFCGLGLLLVLWPFIAPESWPTRWVKQQAGIRPLMWEVALTIGREQPFVGRGLGTFFVESSRGFTTQFAAHEYAPNILETAHSMPLHLLAEVGLIGIALAAWLLIQSLFIARRAAADASHVDRALIRGLVCGGIGMLAQAAISTEIHYVEVTVQLMLALALIGGMRLQQEPTRGLPGRWPTWARAALAIPVGILLLAVTLSGLISQIDLQRGLEIKNRVNQAGFAKEKFELLDQSNSFLIKSIHSTWPCFPTLFARLRLTENCLAAAGILQGVRRDGSSRYHEAAVQAQAIDELAPNFSYVRLIRAQLFRMQGRYSEAVDALISYSEKDPFNKQMYIEWLDVLRQAKHEGHPETARALEAIDLLDQVQNCPSKWLRPEDARHLQQQFKSILNAPPNP